MQIFPGDKKQHFAKIQKSSGIEYEEILFFDDEARNRNVETLGVVMCLVTDGVSKGEVDRGIREWRMKNGREKE
jgi:magnesium-dependent phosphatase 1